MAASAIFPFRLLFELQALPALLIDLWLIHQLCFCLIPPTALVAYPRCSDPEARDLAKPINTIRSSVEDRLVLRSHALGEPTSPARETCLYIILLVTVV